MLRNLARGLLDRVPLSVYRLLIRRPYLALSYHYAAEGELPAHVSHYGPLERDLLTLKRAFRPIRYEALRDHVVSGAPLPPRAILVTVDDGLSQCFTHMRPLLLKHDVPAVFFVTTGFLDNRGLQNDFKIALCLARLREAPDLLRRAADAMGEPAGTLGALSARLLYPEIPSDEAVDALCRAIGVDVDRYLRETRPYLTLDQVRALRGDGFAIGSHGLRHRHLGRLPLAQARDAIVGSCTDLAAALGVPSVPFAFPYEADGFDRTALAEIAGRPPVDLCFDMHGLRRERGLVNRFCCDQVAVVEKIRSAYAIEA
jgi:peptidoglycan/xylan/chitin deacetylase (PgdA/CDA1 family)